MFAASILSKALFALTFTSLSSILLMSQRDGPVSQAGYCEGTAYLRKGSRSALIDFLRHHTKDTFICEMHSFARDQHCVCHTEILSLFLSVLIVHKIWSLIVFGQYTLSGRHLFATWICWKIFDKLTTLAGDQVSPSKIYSRNGANTFQEV